MWLFYISQQILSNTLKADRRALSQLCMGKRALKYIKKESPSWRYEVHASGDMAGKQKLALRL